MSYFDNDEFESDEDFEEDPKELYGIRDGVLFLIDATPPMFENDPDEGIPYFLQCIRKYKDILKEKLVWNRQDWMGLTLFGTEKWDPDSETKHILTLQKLKLVSVDNLKEIMRIDEGKKWEDYKKMASPNVYPLHNALWYAAGTFNSINVTMPMRRVILFTCQDNPPLAVSEQHRIRVKATSYNDIGLKLTVIGLGKNWNHDLFYKDLEMLSQKIDTDDYERQSLNDLLGQVKLPSRNMARLPWRLRENVTVDVAVRSICVKAQYVKKVSISKATNIPLITCKYLKKIEESDHESDAENEDADRTSSPILEIDTQKYQQFGDRKIYFTQREVAFLNATRKPGIDLICLKPIFYEPLYHYGAPYFIIPAKSNRKDNDLVFAALLNKCDARNLMVVCAVTIRERSATNLFVMMPSMRKGGFYLYKVPYKENVRQFNEFCSEYMFDEDENKPPSNPEGVEVLENMIERLKVEYSPELFKNPKLQVQLRNIETLALDLEESKPLPDTTIRDPDEMRDLIKDLLSTYNEIFSQTEVDEPPPKKKSKKPNGVSADPAGTYSEDSIRKFVTDDQISNFTNPQLKDMLKTLGLKTSGKKEDLINRIIEFCT